MSFLIRVDSRMVEGKRMTATAMMQMITKITIMIKRGKFSLYKTRGKTFLQVALYLSFYFIFALVMLLNER